MDPLSITAAVLSVSTTCYSTATFLHDVRCKYKDAPMTITSICSETTVVNASLSHLQTLILQKDDLERVLHGRPDLASALDCSMIGCMMLLSCLNDEIARVTRTTQGGNVSWKGRASLVWNHDKLRQLLADLRGQQTALGTLVNLFQVNSLARIQDLLERNRITFEETVERTRTLREKDPAIKIPESIYSNEPERNGNLFSIRASDTFSAHSGWQPSEVEFAFDDEVVNSQAYRRLLAKAIGKQKTLPDSSSNSVHFFAIDDEAETEEARRLRTQMEEPSTAGKWRFKCHSCYTTLGSRMEFLLHLERKCKSLMVWYCPDCPKQYRRLYNLRSHHKTHCAENDCNHLANARGHVPSKTILGCGYCILWFESTPEFCHHLANHFLHDTIKPDWSPSKSIESLLLHPRIRTSWKAICAIRLGVSEEDWPDMIWTMTDTEGEEVQTLEYSEDGQDLQVCLARLLEKGLYGQGPRPPFSGMSGLPPLGSSNLELSLWAD